jgi:hypothetical protein
MINYEDDNVVEDIHQAELYKRFARLFPLKSEGLHGICDIRVAFGLSADRASLSKQKTKNDYAFLPVLLSLINWPIWVRNQEKYLLLSSIPPLKSHNPTLYFGIIIQYTPLNINYCVCMHVCMCVCVCVLYTYISIYRAFGG